MKNIKLLLAAVSILLASCGVSNKTTDDSKTAADSTTVATNENASNEKVLIAKMEIPSTTAATAPITLKFTVYNHSDSTLTFCKWHTPFERLMSKYLDVVDETGKEAEYKGPMAKRIMPPPADSYMQVKPGDSISVSTNLNDAYAIQKPGKYSVRYNSSEISGLIVKDSLSFTLLR